MASPYAPAFVVHGLLLGILLPILLAISGFIGVFLFEKEVDRRASLYAEEQTIKAQIAETQKKRDDLSYLGDLAKELKATRLRSLITTTTQSFPRVGLTPNHLAHTVSFESQDPFGNMPGFEPERITLNARGRYLILAEAAGLLDQAVPGLLLSTWQLSPAPGQDTNDRSRQVLSLQAVYGALSVGAADAVMFSSASPSTNVAP